MIKMADEMDQLFNDIIRECKSKERLSQFSDSVRDRLKKYDRNLRKEIVSRKKDNLTPLHEACEMGHVEMVEYLISTCGADVEQTGWRSSDQDDERTALWIAAANGRTEVVECLLSHGSQVNALSASGITPVLAALCWSRGRLNDVVKCLMKHGADIHRANRDGETCLMVAACHVDTCEVLLKNGVDVNARNGDNETALHYAIEGKSLDTVKLLLDHGADVTIMTSVDNSDALQTACLERCQPIFDYLVEHRSYSPGRLADAYELMGAHCFDARETALKYWRKAIEIRNANAVDGNPLAKTPSMPTRDCYRNASEFTTFDELDAIALDSDALRIQSVLIHERILGDHSGTFNALYRLAGDAYAKTSRYQDCFVFWRRALEIGATHDSLWEDVADVALILVRALYELHKRIPLEEADPNQVSKEQSRFADVVAILKLLTIRLVTVQPSSESYDDDTILICITHLIYLLVKMARSSEAEAEVRALVRHLVNQNPMSPETQDTLLHLCVFNHSTISSIALYAKVLYCHMNLPTFPDLEVAKLLLECEADVNARNVNGKTPLHVAISCLKNFSNQLVELLLDHGAHLDMPDKSGSTPAHILSANHDNTVDLGKYMTLRCLAARAVVKSGIPCNDLPASVNQFLDLHRLL